MNEHNDSKVIFLFLAAMVMTLVGFLLLNNQIRDLEEKVEFYETNLRHGSYWKIVELYDDKRDEIKYWHILVRGPVSPPPPEETMEAEPR